MLLRLGLLFTLLLSFVIQVHEQKYLVLDRYGAKRIRIYPGEEVVFRIKGERQRQQAVLTELQDSVIVLAGDVYLKLGSFDAFYFDRAGLRGIRNGSWTLVAGFLIAAAVEPLVSDPFYDPRESAYIGLGIFALAQSTRLYQWKKFRINKRSRIWIGGTAGLRK